MCREKKGGQSREVRSAVKKNNRQRGMTGQSKKRKTWEKGQAEKGLLRSHQAINSKQEKLGLPGRGEEVGRGEETREK